MQRGLYTLWWALPLEAGGYKKVMKRDKILQRLREEGCRITKQRRILLDIILEEECSCCKEIYYKAVKKDARIGTATVYRMIHTLEEIGAINRKNIYQIMDGKKEKGKLEDACQVELEDGTVYKLSASKWNLIIAEGLKACGYLEKEAVQNITIKSCTPYIEEKRKK